MAIFQFQVFSTSNLLPGSGPPPSQAIGTSQTNGNPQVGDTFTIGNEAGAIISIEDNENNLFEDDTDTPQFLDQPLDIGTSSFPAGTQVQNEFFFETDQLDDDGDPILIIALRFQPPTGGLTTVAYALTGPLPAGTTLEIVDTFNNPSGPTAIEFPQIVCFTEGTLIETGDGRDARIETLTLGDLVTTLDNGAQPIRWIGSKTLDQTVLQACPNLRPIRIKAGALSEGVPARDLVVSPQHRLFLRSKIAERMFATKEVLIPAKHLLGLPGVEVAADMTSVRYVHVMFDNHEIIHANGAPAETLYTGTEAMKAMSPAAMREIEAIFGDMPYLDRPTARPTPKRQPSRKLIERHVKNNKSLV